MTSRRTQVDFAGEKSKIQYTFWINTGFWPSRPTVKTARHVMVIEASKIASGIFSLVDWISDSDELRIRLDPICEYIPLKNREGRKQAVQ